MEQTNNSISTLYPKIMRLLNNSINSYSGLTKSIVSNVDEIYIETQDDLGNIQKLSVPSFKFLLSEIKRLDNNVNQLSGISDNSSAYVKYGDSIRKIITSKFDTYAQDVQYLNNIVNFNFKSNHFFESLMNPNLYVSFNLTNKIEKNSQSIIVQRYILTDLTENIFDLISETYKNKIDIDRFEFLNFIADNQITYKLDESVINLPPKHIIYDGSFSVLNSYETEYIEVENNISKTKKRRMYTLDKLTYTDIRFELNDNIHIKKGDLLLLNDNSTLFEVDVVENSTNSISLKTHTGYGKISIGDSIFSIYNTDIADIQADINIGFNEYNIIFIKSITENNIPSKNWSNGVCFYTNDLTYNNNGMIETLENFYRREVLDFGIYLQSIVKDRSIPSYLGIKPDAPILNESDFKVVQINKHLYENKAIQEIKDLESEKNKLQSEIDNLIKAINLDRTNQNLTNEKNVKTELYNSIVKEIDSKSTNNDLLGLTPKYRLRGFFQIPNPKVSKEFGKQEIIQFLIYYRYISKSGTANSIEQYQFTDSEKQRIGVIPDWSEIKSAKRSREFDENGIAFWSTEKVEDVDVININSLDIPINKNEILEIKIKSISEAGYPANPLTSDYSNVIRIEFPSELENNSILNDIIDHNKKDLVRVNLQNELINTGFYKHTQNSIDNTQGYFPHSTKDIDSGFKTSEQTIINLYEKLLDMNLKLQKVEEYQNKKQATLNVRIIDSEGNEYSIRKNQQNKIFAGYYSDYVSNLNIIKGKIVTKTYFLIIENLTSTDLELLSRVPGTNTKAVKESKKWKGTSDENYHDYYDNFGTYEETDNDYNSMRKYDYCPILITNPDEYTINNSKIINKVPYQSSQVKSQFIYCRMMDIAKEYELYSMYIPDQDGTLSDSIIYDPLHVENSYIRTTIENKNDGFIWGGSFDLNGLPTKASTFEANNNNSIEVHLNHPYLKNKDVFISAYEKITQKTVTDLNPDYVLLAREMFYHSKFMTFQHDNKSGRKQSMYVYNGVRTTKMSFTEGDEYLLGKKSCGSYLFMSPENHESICVEGKGLLSKKIIQYGNENIVKIPILFQFRMTDYYGDGDNGIGSIAGDSNGLTTNLTYVKELGFDIYDSNNNIFSFDIEVSAKYKQDNLNLDKIPTSKINSALDAISKNLEKTIIKSNIVE